MAHDLVTELLQYSSLACFMPIWQLCANLLIPNCLRSNLSYSPLAALELYVNVYNSQKSDVMSDLALANVEALATGEDDWSYRLFPCAHKPWNECVLSTDTRRDPCSSSSYC